MKRYFQVFLHQKHYFLKKITDLQDEPFDNFLLEVAVLRKLAGHKNIVGLLGAWKRTQRHPFQLIVKTTKKISNSET